MTSRLSSRRSARRRSSVGSPKAPNSSDGRVAEADAEHGPPLGEVVEGDDLLGQHPRAAAGHGRDEGAEAQAAGVGGHRAEQHPRVVHREELLAVEVEVVPDEQAVPARGLGLPGQLEQVADRPDVGRADGEAHPVSLGTPPRTGPSQVGAIRASSDPRHERQPRAAARAGWYVRRVTIRVGVFGAGGRMGATVCGAVAADPELELVAAVDPAHAGEVVEGLTIAAEPDALTEARRRGRRRLHRRRRGPANAAWCAAHGVHAVVGTTGLHGRRPRRLGRGLHRRAAAWSRRTSPSALC